MRMRSLRRHRGFTLIELLVTIAIIAMLAAMLFPSLARAKGSAQKISCVNNLRQLTAAAHMYSDDFEGQYPRRAIPTWITRLFPYYVTAALLKCPGDSQPPISLASLPGPEKAPRSYLMNGWNDYFQITQSETDWSAYKNYTFPSGMKDANIPLPSETIIFGEKKTASAHVHMDFFQGAGNDIQEVEQRRHNASRQGGSSNFAFVDGSVRGLRDGQSLTPFNLWAVTELARTNAALVP